MSVLSPRGGIIHGYVAVVGPESNPNYFTGVAWSALLDDAKVYRTRRGAKAASTLWQNAEGNYRRLPVAWHLAMRAEPVVLNLEPRLL